MKTTKRAISLVLAIMIVMTVVALPASAATISGINWSNQFQSFPELYNGSTQNGYIKMLQRFLLVYPVTYSSIYNASSSYGGVDGGFGNRTQAAVELFQTYTLGSGEADGYVGPKTWGAIRTRLYLSSDELLYNGMNGSPMGGISTKVIKCVQNGSAVQLDTYNHLNNRFYSYFRTIY